MVEYLSYDRSHVKPILKYVKDRGVKTLILGSMSEIDLILKEINASETLVTLIKHDLERPRVIVEDYLALILTIYRYSEGIKPYTLIIVTGRDFVAIVSDDREFINKFKEALNINAYRIRELDVNVAIAVAMLNLIDVYYEILSKIGMEIDELEDVLHKSSRLNIAILRSIKGTLMILRRVFYFSREIVSLLLGKGIYAISRECERLLREVYEDLAHIIEIVEMQLDRLVDLRELHLSLISLNLNEVMKKLTAINVIALPLIIIAGIYGMNFEYMPELHLEYGYFTVLGFMAILTIVLTMFFRKIGWI
ncbi:MAG: CorA family divalent cation transporter [Candidatus Methanomethylicia archaeon]